MTMTRDKREQQLLDACAAANRAAARAAVDIRKRDRLLEKAQGPRSEGKFTFDELARITGLSRTRVSQIVYGIRNGKDSS